MGAAVGQDLQGLQNDCALPDDEAGQPRRFYLVNRVNPV
jgi:hypothetical protein